MAQSSGRCCTPANGKERRRPSAARGTASLRQDYGRALHMAPAIARSTTRPVPRSAGRRGPSRCVSVVSRRRWYETVAH